MLKCVVKFLSCEQYSIRNIVIYTIMTKIPKQGFVKNPIP